MQKFAMVFPGQGSQKPGMLAALAEREPAVKDSFTEASQVLGQDLWEITQTNPDNLLNQTQFTQPALLTASVALWRLWQARKAPQPALLAGHSLGEYSALVCGGVLTFQDAVNLVHLRGRYMQSAVAEGAGRMAAVVGLKDQQINEICTKASEQTGATVSPSNFNSPGQTVIAGATPAVDRAVTLCTEAGAKRAMPLQVSVPSHCALMQPAAEKLTAELNKVQFSPPTIPVIQNVNATPTTHPDEIKHNLIRQLQEPVQWVKTINSIHQASASHAIECGPGKVLCGLIKRTQPNLTCHPTEDPEALEQSIAALC